MNDTNLFNAHVGEISQSSRQAKKIQRAKEHQQHRHHNTHNKHASASAAPTTTTKPPHTNENPSPFFTLAVNGPNTVVALDIHGNELVTLQFDDIDDLFSEEFREFAAAAVAISTTIPSQEDKEQQQQPSFVESSSSNHHPHTTDALSPTELLDFGYEFDQAYDKYITHGSSRSVGGFPLSLVEGNDNNNHSNAILTLEDELTAQALMAEEEEAYIQYLEQQKIDEDFALALHVAQQLHVHGDEERRSGGGGSSMREGFPALPTSRQPPLPLVPRSARGSVQHTIQGGWGVAKKKEKIKPSSSDVVINLVSSDDDDKPTKVLLKQEFADIELQSQGYRRHQDDLAQPSLDFLDTFSSDAVQAREQAVQWARERTRGPSNSLSSSTTIDAATMKKMMATTTSTTAEENIEQGEEEKREYCRKSLRKLILSMVRSGWVPVRKGNHSVYQRYVPPTQEKQILVIPCTPSDRRTIDAIHSNLQRLDRQATAIRHRALSASS